MPTLADRMKTHEHAHRHTLPTRIYTLIRLDGKAFHSYTRHLQRPYDPQFAADMDTTTQALTTHITGTVLAYTQSDEISLLLQDFATPNTQPWMGGVTAKMLSLSAALATATFNRLRPPPTPTAEPALFDARVFTLTTPDDVADYFIWRQHDAVKNSISMAAAAHFSPKQLHGLNTDQRRALLHTETGINWDDYPDGFKHGRITTRTATPGTATYTRDGRTHTTDVTRHVWATNPAPTFATDPTRWLHQAIPPIP